MEPEMVVREATVDDYPALNSLWTEADQLHHEGSPEVFAKPAGFARSPAFVQSSLDDRSQKLLVAIAQDRIVGFVHITHRDRNAPFIAKRIAIVEEIVVSAERRGEGIGRRLMAEAEAWAMNQGAEELWLDVWEFNEGAIGFYASLGFETATLRMRKRVD
jgi:ribosomal protein S18 acetylase RimI-like enzyme